VPTVIPMPMQPSPDGEKLSAITSLIGGVAVVSRTDDEVAPPS
jgi:hypothetical protein